MTLDSWQCFGHDSLKKLRKNAPLVSFLFQSETFATVGGFTLYYDVAKVMHQCFVDLDVILFIHLEIVFFFIVSFYELSAQKKWQPCI